MMTHIMSRRQRALVLVAHGVDENKREIESLLNQEGYQVDVVPSGPAMLEYFERAIRNPDRRIPDIVVVDLAEGASTEEVEFLRGLDWAVPIVAIASSARPEAWDESYRLGVDEVLPDPIDPDELCDAVVDLVPPTF